MHSRHQYERKHELELEPTVARNEQEEEDGPGKQSFAPRVDRVVHVGRCGDVDASPSLGQLYPPPEGAGLNTHYTFTRYLQKRSRQSKAVPCRQSLVDSSLCLAYSLVLSPRSCFVSCLRLPLASKPLLPPSLPSLLFMIVASDSLCPVFFLFCVLSPCVVPTVVLVIPSFFLRFCWINCVYGYLAPVFSLPAPGRLMTPLPQQTLTRPCSLMSSSSSLYRR